LFDGVVGVIIDHSFTEILFVIKENTSHTGAFGGASDVGKILYSYRPVIE
jgi:hypothetical protein